MPTDGPEELKASVEHERYCSSTEQIIKRVTDDIVLECADQIDEYVSLLASIRCSVDGEYLYLSEQVNCLSSAAVIYDIDFARIMDQNISGSLMCREDADNRMYRIRRVFPKQVRGRVTRLMPLMYSHERLFPFSERNLAKAEFRRWYVGVAPDGRTLHNISGRPGVGPHVLGKKIGDLEKEIALIHIAMLNGANHHWGVCFRVPGTKSSLKIMVDRKLAYRLFKHRELGDKRKRRASLKHLVSEYWRCIDRVGDSAELQAFTREHLRGQSFFQWFDLECAIIPSLYDMRRIENAKSLRPLMRNTGEDRRVIQMSS